MSCSLYGSAVYGTDTYGHVCKDSYFRYKCGISVEKDVYFRYQALGSVFKDRYFRYEAKGGVINAVKFRYLAGGWLNFGRRFRYNSPQGITKDRKFRYEGLQGVLRNKIFRYSNSVTTREAKFRYACKKPVVRETYFRYTPLSSQYMIVAGGNPSGVSGTGGGGTVSNPYTNPLQGYLYATSTAIPNSNDLGIVSFGVSFKESEPARWSLGIVDTTGYYNPKNAGSPWYNKMDDEPYSSGNLVKFLRSGLTYGGMPFEFIGVPLSYSWSQNFRDRVFRFVWSGIDTTDALFRESQNFETYRTRINNIVRAKELITTILGVYGFTARLDFDDFVIPVGHFQNQKPIEYIKAILEVVGAEWILEGTNVFHAYVPSDRNNPNWIFDTSGDGIDYILIPDMSVQSDYGDIVNQVTVARAREVGQSEPNSDSEGGNGNEMTVDDFGEYSLTFDKPLNGVFWRPIEEHLGFFANFVFKDPNENVVAVWNPLVSGYAASVLGVPIYNAKSVTFTWHAQPNVLAAGGFGKIRFFGTTNDTFAGVSADSLTPGQFDTTFTVTARYTDSYSKHGPKPLELSPNPLIPTEAIAKIHAREYIRRVFRERNTTKYKIYLNIMVKVGDVIKEVHDQIGTTRYLYVSEVSHNFSNNPADRFTIVTANEYPPGFSVTYL